MTADPARHPSDLAPRLERLFDFVPAETTGARLTLEGRLPDGLRGDAYWIGPARFERGGVRYRNWLDGDGMALRLHFGADGVEYTARFVRGEKWRDEEQAGRALYRAFGTAFPGDRLLRGVALASPLNVSILPWQGRMLAFGEQGLPVALDAVTLETLGPHDFGRRAAITPITPFSAHPALDPGSGELWNFGVSFAAERPQLQLFRFSAQGELLLRRRLPLDHPISLHDVSLSPRFAVFHLSPYVLDMAALLGGGTVLDALTWKPALGTRLLVVARESGDVVSSIPLEGGYCLHQVNAFEVDDGRLIVDFLELHEPVYPDYQGLPDLFVDVEPAHTVRLTVDPERGALLERRKSGPGIAADFPSLDPALTARPYRHFWMLGISRTGAAGRKFFDRLMHFDWQRGDVAGHWDTEPPRYIGCEPLLAPAPESAGGGWVLCQEHDLERRAGAFLVFDALDVARGPLARLHLPAPAPAMFHGIFHPAEAPR